MADDQLPGDDQIQLEEQKKKKPPSLKDLPSSNYSRVEKLMIVLGLVIVGVMAYSYFADVPLRKLFFPNGSDTVSSIQVGTMVKVEGRVLRQRASDFEFKPIEENAPLFANDTIMTGPASTATIVLLNGRKIELKPNSLVKLTYGAELSKDGVRIDVLRGSTSDDAARIVPLKGLFQGKYDEYVEPLAVSAPAPADDLSLQFSEAELAARQKKVELSVALNRDTKHMSLQVLYVDPVSGKEAVVATVSPTISELRARATFAFSRAGHYEWQVLGEKDEVLLTQKLRIIPEVEAIHVLPPLDVSTDVEGDAAKRAYPGPELRWQPVEGPGAYFVRVFKPGADKPFLEKETVEPSLRLSAKEVRFERKKLFYTIEKSVARGFVVVSGKQSFSITVNPPALSAPEAGAIIDRARLYKSNNAVLFTWTKTNYAAKYHFELATEPHFKRPVIDLVLKDNYTSYMAPSPSKYHWRVRAEIDGRWTEFSEPRELTVDLPIE